MPAVVNCPFYRRDRDLRIWCEAGRVILPDRIAKRRFMGAGCCADHWQACPMARALLDYYERGGDSHAP